MRHRLGAVRGRARGPIGPTCSRFSPSRRRRSCRRARVVAGAAGAWTRGAARRFGGFFDRLGAGGGVGFTRLGHASANEALEILLGEASSVSFGYTTAHSPAARRGDAKDDERIRGCAPLCLAMTPAGAESLEVGRGSSPRVCWRLGCGSQDSARLSAVAASPRRLGSRQSRLRRDISALGSRGFAATSRLSALGNCVRSCRRYGHPAPGHPATPVVVAVPVTRNPVTRNPTNQQLPQSRRTGVAE